MAMSLRVEKVKPLAAHEPAVIACQMSRSTLVSLFPRYALYTTTIYLFLVCIERSCLNFRRTLHHFD